MEQEREDMVDEVLYEIRHHARRALSSDPSSQQMSKGSKVGLLSYLSVQGVNRLKEKWNQYKRPMTFKKKISLFVSPDGEHVAVAAENQIFILQKDDDHMEPCGIFTSNDRLTVFTNGAWLEPHGILGVIDDLSTLYFIKANGEEMTRRTRDQLKLSAPITDLVVQDELNSKKSYLCGFCIITADGLIHHVEVTQEPSACTNPISSSSSCIMQRGQFPRNVSCLDFHPHLPLAVLAGDSSVSENSKDGSGTYSLYVLHLTTNSELEIMFCSPQLEGLFSCPRGHTRFLTSPKVAISPQGKYVATLDLTGCLNVFKLDSEVYSLSFLPIAEREHPHISDCLASGKKKYFKDIIDVSWWADHILAFAKKSGGLIMYDILRGMEIMEKDQISVSVIERVEHRSGYVFILEGTTSGDSMSEHIGKSSQHIEHDAYENDDQPDTDGSWWSLMSLSERSVSEMYNILISNQEYQAALDFASRHDLDTDEVFKAQWMHSDQGIHEINMFLSKIKDQTFTLSECVDRVGPTEDAVKALLSYGIHVTDRYVFSDSDESQCSLIWDMRMFRLQLLQYRDRLETFVGINMGRFSSQEYCKFRSVHLAEVALALAETGRIGALNLLFKRHPYSISPRILDILSSIPETVPVQSYGQLLPGRSPPSIIVLRDGDWVECEKMVSFINKLPSGSEKSDQFLTEIMLKHSQGLVWPSVAELSDWYRNRAREIDNLSGQLENCLSLAEFACHKGIVELQQFLEDISYLHQLIYSDGLDQDFIMSLIMWEQLPDYEKFKMMLKGVKEDMVVQRLQERAIPFMQNRDFAETLGSQNQVKEDHSFVHCAYEESFLVRWLKEIAAENRLDICLSVIENGCGELPVDGLFKDERETIETALQCIYLCTLMDQWNMMASILSKLPRNKLSENSSEAGTNFTPRHGTRSLGVTKFSDMTNQLGKLQVLSNSASLHNGVFVSEDSGRCTNQLDADLINDNLEKRIKVAEGHVEVGRLLAYYQVPKPMSFFLSAQSDEKNVKQLLRLILSKFGRRQPSRSDNDWANMWRDMQCFQEKAFPFLDLEYMLTEFIRGLLKAGKFSLARNYLKGTGSIALTTEKAENLVIQAAREYFFSASSLSCNEIWKAKECLSLFPNSRSVKAEADIIDALTIRLPNLGVILLPVQFRQIRNPMEIINMVISSQTGAYLNVEELIEIGKLLGLSSQDDIAAVEEAVAREAAIAGDLQLAFDLCLVLAKKGHGPIWDLCAAIARGPHLDNMDTNSRKQLLGFALSHCDEESIGELLNAWKEVDMRLQLEQLITLTGTNPPNFSVQGPSIISLPVHSVQDIFDIRDSLDSVQLDPCNKRGNNDVHFNNIKQILSNVGKDLPTEDGIKWDSLLRENKRVLSFAALELPWLLELCGKEEYCKKTIPGTKTPFRKHNISIRMQVLVSILYWLANNGIVPSDDLIASLAKSIMEPPVTEADDVLGCSYLLNLVDAFHGVEIIEEQLKRREAYQEIYSIMNIGMAYSSLNNSQKECSSPNQRRKMLLNKFHEKHASFSSDEIDQIDKVQSTFWREWKTKLEEQKRLADQARELEQIIPEVETARFLSGDVNYIRNVVYSFIDSVKMEKKHILKEAVKLADTYGLNRTEVLLQFFGCALVSEHWGNDDILAEISEFREDIVKHATGVINMIFSIVYQEIDGHNKQRLSYIYNILSACFLRLRRTEDPALVTYLEQGHINMLEPFQFYKVLEQECQRISFINGLNFKNIAGLDDLNFEHFNEEICNNVHESTVEALADTVRSLVSLYDDSQAKGLISWEGVYKHHVLGQLAFLEGRNEARSNSINADELQALIEENELNYDRCKKYVRALPKADISYIIGRYCTLCFPCNFSRSLPDNPAWKDCLIMLLTFWIRMVENISDKLTTEGFLEKPLHSEPKNLLRCLNVFKILVMENEVSADQGWSTVSNYVKFGLVGGLTLDILPFCKAMVFSGCAFRSIAEAYSKAEPHPAVSSLDSKGRDLLDLYINLADTFLSDLRSSNEHQNLHHLLSSLSKLVGNHNEDLMMIRSEVWAKLSAFSDNMQLESHRRVYALQLMQSITGRNLKSLPAELVSEVEPWEEWDESGCVNTDVAAEGADVSSSITSTLVALKSSQLAAAISPNIKITPEDLMTVDSAVSCFLRLSESVDSVENLHVLRAVLEEWEELFSAKTEKEMTNESPKESTNWSSDGWDEGWENLPEELVNMDGKQDGCIIVRPLHACWMEVIRRFIELSKPGVVLELLAQSSSVTDATLLNEDEAQRMFQHVVGVDCFMALKMLLLLPYEGLHSQCLCLVEAKLREGSISCTSNANDYELLALLLSSGALHQIATDPSYSKVLSHICFSMGHLARICQEDMLKYSKGDRSRLHQNSSSLFARVLLPCFISELVTAGQSMLAGFIISRWMHTHASLGLIDVAEVSLRRYLEGQFLQAQARGGGEAGFEELGSCGSLVYAVSSLRVKLVSLLQSALLALPDNNAK
ncbi:MAG2-interacting protein 2 [Elaeis guineensis]|uniref:MAG2-interacting protein 2 isoform X1 n=1 Tax=Elaeis guineensis var. tenera TaxID=51953 RepID=A0A6J0PBP4_ELAGV|nr:MAG2-interacting protein 2 isoform X1 [Elaeis guineensis]XP_019701963.1 MAG2-interacting protein 2 isoform X2 [Elaeis guineensis]